MLEIGGKSDVAAQMEAAMADNSASCGNDFGKQQKKRPTTKVDRPRVSEKRLPEESNDEARDAMVEGARQERKIAAPPIVSVEFPWTPGDEHHDGGGAFPILPSPSSLSSRTFKEHRKKHSGLWPEWICNLGCDGSSDIAGWDDFNEEIASPIPNPQPIL